MSPAGRQSRMRGSCNLVGTALLRALRSGAGSSTAHRGDGRNAVYLATLAARGTVDAQASGRCSVEAPAARGPSSQLLHRRFVACSAHSNAGGFREGAREGDEVPEASRSPGGGDSPTKYGDELRKDKLIKLLNENRIFLKDYTRGHHNREMLCPECSGGKVRAASPLRTHPLCFPLAVHRTTSRPPLRLISRLSSRVKTKTFASLSERITRARIGSATGRTTAARQARSRSACVPIAVRA